MGEVDDPEGEAPEEEGSQGQPGAPAHGEGRVRHPEDQEGREQGRDDLEVEVKAEPAGQPEEEEGAVAGRGRQGQEGRPRGQQEDDLAEDQVLDVVGAGQDVVGDHVGGRQGGEEQGEEARPVAEQEGGEAVGDQEHAQGDDRRHRVEGQPRDPEEEEGDRRQVGVRHPPIGLAPEEDGELPLEDVDAHEPGDGLVRVEPRRGELEGYDQDGQAQERPEAGVGRGPPQRPPPSSRASAMAWQMERMSSSRRVAPEGR